MTNYCEEELLEIADKFEKVFGAKFSKRSCSKNKENYVGPVIQPLSMQSKGSPRKNPFGEANQIIKSQKQ